MSGPDEDANDRELADGLSKMFGEDAAPRVDDFDEIPSTDEEGEPAPEEASGDDEGEPEPAAEPAIAAPHSWDAKAKEAFAKLPPELQRVVADRESDRERQIGKRLSEIAEAQKAATAERDAASQQRQLYTAQLQQQAMVLNSQMMGEFSDLKTHADVLALSQTDPVRCQRFMLMQQHLGAINAQMQQQQLESERAAKDQKARRDSEEARLLSESDPEFWGGSALQKNVTRAREYLTSIGWDADDISQIGSHKMGQVLKDAMEAADLRAKAKSAATKRIAQAPAVARPGNAAGAAGQTATDMKRLARHGTDRQQAAALARMFAEP